MQCNSLRIWWHQFPFVLLFYSYLHHVTLLSDPTYLLETFSLMGAPHIHTSVVNQQITSWAAAYYCHCLMTLTWLLIEVDISFKVDFSSNSWWNIDLGIVPMIWCFTFYPEKNLPYNGLSLECASFWSTIVYSLPTQYDRHFVNQESYALWVIHILHRKWERYSKAS